MEAYADRFYLLTTNENGFEIEMWIGFKETWSAITNLHGREYFQAAAIQAENTVKFTIRYTDEIDETMRVLFKDEQYNIISIDNIKYSNKFIEIKAMRVSQHSNTIPNPILGT